MDKQHVRIFDTTLRDGEQSPGFSLYPAEKLQLARQLDAARFDTLDLRAAMELGVATESAEVVSS